MKWQDTVASKCRYGHVAEHIWGNADVIWENSDDNYQGRVAFLAKQADGNFVFCEWIYGSRPGCDDWENRGLSDDQIREEMIREAIFFDNKGDLLQFLMLPEKQYKSSGGFTNGSLAGMLDFLILLVALSID